MVVEAAPPTSFEVAEPDLLLELLVIALDAPAQFGEIDQAAETNVFWQGRKPVFGRRVLARGPLDQQPFFRPRFSEPIISMRDANTHASEPREQPLGHAFPPFDRAPGARGKATRQCPNRDRPMFGVTADQLRRTSLT